MLMLRSLLLVILCTPVFAAEFSTGKLFHASALIPPPREEIFLTRDGRADWMFDDKDNVITPAVVGTEGRAVFTLGKENSVIGWGNFEGKQPHAQRVHLWEGVMTHWKEHEEFAETLAARDGWPRPFQMTYQAQANSDTTREVFTQNLLTTDPQMVVWGFCDLRCEDRSTLSNAARLQF